MAQQTINRGTAANDGTGDTLRSAAAKINSNFTELYTQNTTLAAVATSGNLTSLTDVTISTATTGDVLRFTGSAFVNSPLNLSDLANVATTAPTTNQYLQWNGTSWVPATGSGSISLSSLSVTQASASGAGALAYNNTTGVFTYTPPTLTGLGYTAPTQLSLGIGNADVDFGQFKIKYANKYDNESDLPSAVTYHGMFAHVHATGKAYYAHAGNWEKMITESTFKTLVAASTDFADFKTRIAAI